MAIYYITKRLGYVNPQAVEIAAIKRRSIKLLAIDGVAIDNVDDVPTTPIKATARAADYLFEVNTLTKGEAESLADEVRDASEYGDEHKSEEEDMEATNA